jgi:hypothetical protein
MNRIAYIEIPLLEASDEVGYAQIVKYIPTLVPFDQLEVQALLYRLKLFLREESAF